MKNIFLLLFCCSIFSAQAQNIVWDGTHQNITIGNQLSTLEDAKGSFSIEQIASDSFQKKFTPSEKIILNFGFTESYYWLRFTLDNSINDDLYLEIAHAFLPVTELYFADSTGKFVKMEAGYKIPVHQKIIKSHFQVFPLPMGKHTFYVKLLSNSHPLPVKIFKKDAHEIKADNQQMVYGFYMGFMLFVILSNLFFFVSLRNRLYLFYALVVCIYASYAAMVMDGFVIYFFPHVDMMFWYVVIPTIGVPIQTIYCLWFLEVKNASPKLYKTVVGITIYFIAYALIRFFCPLKVTLAINTVNALLSYFLMGYVGYKIGKKGNRLGYYFAWAYFIYFLLVLTEATYIQTGKPAYFIGLSHVGLATLIEAFIFTFLISKRFEWEKEELERMKLEATEKLLESTMENERIVKEQNAILETKVSERTSELNNTLEDLKHTQSQLIQNEKLASLGQLTAGIAHEINNPINFVSSNISPLKRDFADLETIFKRYKESGIEPNDKVLQQMIKDMDIDYTFTEIKELLKGIEEGAKRTADIVRGLKTFARTDEQKKSEYEIQEGLEGTLLLLNSKIVAKEILIEKNYAQLPLVKCFAGKINQVFMNIIANAIDASNQKGKISIKTWCENDKAFISITDNGQGMSEATKLKIFDPFFTTKDVGSGTGLGLSITYGIIESHNGKIEVNSEVGNGTEFIITLPINN
ncbi:MAG: hypothetical protein RL708_1872 [Bacteroidota bacterium]|jgi:signal transduction histidine kinase